MTIPSFMSDMQTALGLSSNYATEFRAYLGLKAGQTIPDDSFTADKYIQFLGSQEGDSLAAFFLAAIRQQQGSTEILDYPTLIDEFRGSLGMGTSLSISDTPDIRRQFMYFLSSPLTIAANAAFGTSSEAADSLKIFRWEEGDANTGSPMSDTAATASAYLEWLSLFVRLNEGQGATSDTNIFIFLQDTLQSFNNTSLTADVLTKFRSYLGLSNSDAIPNDTATRAAFLSFLQQTQSVVQQSEAVNAISPQEQEIRNAIFATFAIILKMLNVLQGAAQVEAKSQQIYADWMSAITDQISATPMYGPTDENNIIANSKDFGKTTLGYGNITVRDVLKSLMNQLQTNNSTDETFTVSNPNLQNLTDYPSSTVGFPRFELQKNNDGSFTFLIEAPTGAEPDNGEVPTSWTTVMSATVPASTSLITNQTTTSAIVENLLSQMTTTWNSSSSISTIQPITFWTPTRDTSGNIVYGGLGDTQSLVIDLKQAWKTNGTTVTVYTPNVSLSTAAWDTIYNDWTNGYVLSGGTMFNASGNVDETTKYVLSQMSASGATIWDTTIGSVNDGVHSGYFTLKYVKISPTEFQLYWKLTSTDEGGGVSTSMPDSSWSEKYDFTTVTQQIPVSTGLWGPWEQAWTDTIAYPSSFDKASLQAVQSSEQTYRGEVNAQLQLYLQSTQARQDNVSTALKNMQNLSSQTTQAVTNMINTLDTFMQTLTSILSALFH